MNHKKLSEVLKALNPEQMDRLTDFVHSPYFNKNASLISLYNYLKTLHPEYRQDMITSQSIIKKVHGIADENDLAKKMTQLLDLVGKFLSMEYNQDAVLERIGTLKAYKKLHLNKQFESLANELRKELKDDPFRDFDYFWRVHKLEEECFEGFNQGLLRTPENSFDIVLQSLSQFYHTKKLRYAAEAAHRVRLLGNAISNELNGEITSFLNKNLENQDLYTTLYGNVIKMHFEGSPDKAFTYYQKIKTTIKAFQELIPKEEMKSICIHLQNFCIKFINKENKSFLKEYIELIQLRIDNEILIEEGLINPQHFKNVVVAAIKLNMHSWAQTFVKKFEKYLPDEFRSDYYNFALGLLYYHRKEFGKASVHLAKANHNKKDVYFGFAIKKLLLRVAYESNNIFLLTPLLANYKKHLERYRTKIGDNAIHIYKFLIYFRMLVNADQDVDKIEILLNKLLTEEDFADKDWLVKMASRTITSGSPIRTEEDEKLRSVYINSL